MNVQALTVWLTDTLKGAWSFIVSPGNIQLVIGIVLIVLIAQVLLRGTGRIMDTIFMGVVSLFAVHFFMQYMGLNFDILSVLSGFLDFAKQLFESLLKVVAQ